MRAPRSIALAVVVAFVSAACGSGNGSGALKVAQARVTSKEKALSEAQTQLEHAHSTFCQDSEAYIRAVDQYGKVVDDTAVTVGDVKSAGNDLERPRDDVTTSANEVVTAREGVSTAQQELADAQSALAKAKGSSSSAPSTTTSTTLVPTATIDRVTAAETDFTTATQRVTDETPLVRAGIEVNAAAFALEAAWLRLFADAGCLTGDQMEKAEAAIAAYTTELQTALKATGHYDGKIDGVYGPATLDAVASLQKSKGLPVTGYVDRATAAALTNELLAKGGAAATTALAHTAGVQATLKVAGYWNGPVDGQWTPALTDALKAAQADLGVPQTGTVDTATLNAIEARAQASNGAPNPSTTVNPSTGTTTTSSG
jgi:murein L,D-transpeptidase YcbB/YkuD